MVRFYGPVGQNQTTIQLPFPMVLDWQPGTAIHKMTCHERVADSLQRILKNMFSEYGLARIQQLGIDQFGGCLNVRKMRGGSAWSIHSWGAAVDLDADRNTLRETHETARFARPEYAPMWRIIEGEGWVSLGRARDYDWMHFQAARL